jgi:hypothetical protein
MGVVEVEWMDVTTTRRRGFCGCLILEMDPLFIRARARRSACALYVRCGSDGGGTDGRWLLGKGAIELGVREGTTENGRRCYWLPAAFVTTSVRPGPRYCYC